MTLDDLRRLHEAATPGPWEADSAPPATDELYCTMRSLDGPNGLPVAEVLGESNDNMDLIVAMRNKLPALLACIEAADDIFCPMCGVKLSEPDEKVEGCDCDEYRQARAKLDEVGA